MTNTPSRQQGVSLVVTLVLVILLSLIALYGAGVLVLDTRSAANDFRARQALAAAESGIEQGFGYLDINRNSIASGAWVDCTGGEFVAPCAAIRSDDRANWRYRDVSALTSQPTQGGSFELYLMTPRSGEGAWLVYQVVASGASSDSTSTVVVKQSAYFYPLMARIPDSAIMSVGNIGGSGTFDVVANPNGGGTGVPISAWTRSTVTMGGTAKTCQLQEFLDSKDASFHTVVTDSAGKSLTKCSSCSCPSSGALSAGTPGPDIVQNDTANFPADVFNYIFGVPALSYQEVKKEATAADCSGLNTASSGLLWATGDCSINGSVGSFDKPVLLVVQDGDLTITGGGEIFGMVFIFGSSGSGNATVHLAGGPTFYGAIVTNINVDMGNGTYKMRFDANVLKNLWEGLFARALTRLPGSWSDVQ